MCCGVSAGVEPADAARHAGRCDQCGAVERSTDFRLCEAGAGHLQFRDRLRRDQHVEAFTRTGRRHGPVMRAPGNAARQTDALPGRKRIDPLGHRQREQLVDGTGGVFVEHIDVRCTCQVDVHRQCVADTDAITVEQGIFDAAIGFQHARLEFDRHRRTRRVPGDVRQRECNRTGAGNGDRLEPGSCSRGCGCDSVRRCGGLACARKDRIQRRSKLAGTAKPPFRHPIDGAFDQGTEARVDVWHQIDQMCAPTVTVCLLEIGQ